MAVSTEVTNVSYPGNNSTVIEYPVPFPVTDGSQIKVGVKPSGEAFAQLPSWAYTIVVSGGGAFSIKTLAPVLSTSIIVIWREVPATQPVELPLAGRLPSTSIESGLDRATMQIQELKATLARAIKLDRSADQQSDVIPTPNALFGFDAEGNFEPMDATRVRELAQLEGDGSNATVTWPDDTARASTVPNFIGQVGIQRSDKSTWVSQSLTAGDWAKARIPHESATNEAELYSAIATSKIVRIKGVITLSAGLVLDANEDLTLEGDGPNATLLLPHDGATQQTVCWVKSKRVKLRGLAFSTNHPLTSGRAYQDIGVRLAVDAGDDCSGLSIHQCRFNNLGWGILRDGTSASEVADDVRITQCTFEGIFQGAIYLRWFCHNLRVIDNVFRQRTATQTHDIEYNPILVSNRCDNSIIAFNSIKRFGRIAIEVWNSSEDPLAAASNNNVLVCDNDISEPLPWSTHTPIGVSILGKGAIRYVDNSVDGCVLGLEIAGDPVNDGRHSATGNIITNSKTQAFSVNNTNHTLVAHNLINRVAVDGFPGITSETSGVQIINGARNLRFHDNTFEDAGRFNIFLNGKSLTITGITQAADAVFTVSAIGDATQPNGWFPGKRVCLRGLAGAAGSMADLNDKYYTLTWVSGTQFKLGVDTSGKTAYVSGGRVQEDYVGLSIKGNTFYVHQELNALWSGPSSFARAIYMYDFQQASVQNNERFVNNTLSGYWGSFSAINYGVVYQDAAGGTVSTTGAEVVIAGTNRSISIFP